MPLKKTSQASHARKRVYSRYGSSISDKQYKELSNIIAKGKGKILHKQTNTRYIVHVNYNGNSYHVAYDASRRQIATFLTKEMVEERVGKGENHV